MAEEVSKARRLSNWISPFGKRKANDDKWSPFGSSRLAKRFKSQREKASSSSIASLSSEAKVIEGYYESTTHELNTHCEVTLESREEVLMKKATQAHKKNNKPSYREIFWFSVCDLHHGNRIVISAFEKRQKSSLLVGCMSFGVRNILNDTKVSDGWFYLLEPETGRSKHLAVPDMTTALRDMNGRDGRQSRNNILPRLQIINVTLGRDHRGKYGFKLQNTLPVSLNKVVPGGPAQSVGVRDGDTFIELDGFNVAGASSDLISSILRQGTAPMTALLQRTGDHAITPTRSATTRHPKRKQTPIRHAVSLHYKTSTGGRKFISSPGLSSPMQRVSLSKSRARMSKARTVSPYSPLLQHRLQKELAYKVAMRNSRKSSSEDWPVESAPHGTEHQVMNGGMSEVVARHSSKENNSGDRRRGGVWTHRGDDYRRANSVSSGSTADRGESVESGSSSTGKRMSYDGVWMGEKRYSGIEGIDVKVSERAASVSGRTDIDSDIGLSYGGVWMGSTGSSGNHNLDVLGCQMAESLSSRTDVAEDEEERDGMNDGQQSSINWRGSVTVERDDSSGLEAAHGHAGPDPDKDEQGEELDLISGSCRRSTNNVVSTGLPVNGVSGMPTNPEDPALSHDAAGTSPHREQLERTTKRSLNEFGDVFEAADDQDIKSVRDRGVVSPDLGDEEGETLQACSRYRSTQEVPSIPPKPVAGSSDFLNDDTGLSLAPKRSTWTEGDRGERSHDEGRRRGTHGGGSTRLKHSMAVLGNTNVSKELHYETEGAEIHHGEVMGHSGIGSGRCESTSEEAFVGSKNSTEPAEVLGSQNSNAGLSLDHRRHTWVNPGQASDSRTCIEMGRRGTYGGGLSSCRDAAEIPPSTKAGVVSSGDQREGEGIHDNQDSAQDQPQENGNHEITEEEKLCDVDDKRLRSQNVDTELSFAQRRSTWVGRGDYERIPVSGLRRGTYGGEGSGSGRAVLESVAVRANHNKNSKDRSREDIEGPIADQGKLGESEGYPDVQTKQSDTESEGLQKPTDKCHNQAPGHSLTRDDHQHHSSGGSYLGDSKPPPGTLGNADMKLSVAQRPITWFVQDMDAGERPQVDVSRRGSYGGGTMDGKVTQTLGATGASQGQNSQGLARDSAEYHNTARGESHVLPVVKRTPFLEDSKLPSGTLGNADMKLSVAQRPSTWFVKDMDAGERPQVVVSRRCSYEGESMEGKLTQTLGATEASLGQNSQGLSQDSVECHNMVGRGKSHVPLVVKRKPFIQDPKPPSGILVNADMKLSITQRPSTWFVQDMDVGEGLQVDVGRRGSYGGESMDGKLPLKLGATEANQGQNSQGFAQDSVECHNTVRKGKSHVPPVVKRKPFLGDSKPPSVRSGNADMELSVAQRPSTWFVQDMDAGERPQVDVSRRGSYGGESTDLKLALKPGAIEASQGQNSQILTQDSVPYHSTVTGKSHASPVVKRKPGLKSKRLQDPDEKCHDRTAGNLPEGHDQHQSLRGSVLEDSKPPPERSERADMKPSIAQRPSTWFVQDMDAGERPQVDVGRRSSFGGEAMDGKLTPTLGATKFSQGQNSPESAGYHSSTVGETSCVPPVVKRKPSSTKSTRSQNPIEKCHDHTAGNLPGSHDQHQSLQGSVLEDSKPLSERSERADMKPSIAQRPSTWFVQDMDAGERPQVDAGRRGSYGGEAVDGKLTKPQLEGSADQGRMGPSAPSFDRGHHLEEKVDQEPGDQMSTKGAASQGSQPESSNNHRDGAEADVNGDYHRSLIDWPSTGPEETVEGDDPNVGYIDMACVSGLMGNGRGDQSAALASLGDCANGTAVHQWSSVELLNEETGAPGMTADAMAEGDTNTGFSTPSDGVGFGMLDIQASGGGNGVSPKLSGLESDPGIVDLGEAEKEWNPVEHNMEVQFEHDSHTAGVASLWHHETLHSDSVAASTGDIPTGTGRGIVDQESLRNKLDWDESASEVSHGNDAGVLTSGRNGSMDGMETWSKEQSAPGLSDMSWGDEAGMDDDDMAVGTGDQDKSVATREDRTDEVEVLDYSLNVVEEEQHKEEMLGHQLYEPLEAVGDAGFSKLPNSCAGFDSEAGDRDEVTAVGRGTDGSAEGFSSANVELTPIHRTPLLDVRRDTPLNTNANASPSGSQTYQGSVEVRQGLVNQRCVSFHARVQPFTLSDRDYVHMDRLAIQRRAKKYQKLVVLLLTDKIVFGKRWTDGRFKILYDPVMVSDISCLETKCRKACEFHLKTTQPDHPLTTSQGAIVCMAPSQGCKQIWVRHLQRQMLIAKYRGRREFSGVDKSIGMDSAKEDRVHSDDSEKSRSSRNDENCVSRTKYSACVMESNNNSNSESNNHHYSRLLSELSGDEDDIPKCNGPTTENSALNIQNLEKWPSSHKRGQLDSPRGKGMDSPNGDDGDSSSNGGEEGNDLRRCYSNTDRLNSSPRNYSPRNYSHHHTNSLHMVHSTQSTPSVSHRESFKRVKSAPSISPNSPNSCLIVRHPEKKLVRRQSSPPGALKENNSSNSIGSKFRRTIFRRFTGSGTRDDSSVQTLREKKEAKKGRTGMFVEEEAINATPAMEFEETKRGFHSFSSSPQLNMRLSDTNSCSLQGIHTEEVIASDSETRSLQDQPIRRSKTSIAKEIKAKVQSLRRRHTEGSLQETEDNVTPSTTKSGPDLEDIRKWAEGFESLLKDEFGLEAFRKFLQTEFSDENIEFWLACEEYKDLKPSKMVPRAHRIYEDYVTIQAPREVNLDSRTRLQVVSNLSHPNRHSFEQAQKRIEALMEKDSYPRFLRSDIYLKMQKAAKKNK